MHLSPIMLPICQITTIFKETINFSSTILSLCQTNIQLIVIIFLIRIVTRTHFKMQRSTIIPYLNAPNNLKVILCQYNNINCTKIYPGQICVTIWFQHLSVKVKMNMYKKINAKQKIQ